MSDWNDKIIEEFRANGGQLGGQFAGAPLLLLHTVGAKSGQPRVNPTMYQKAPDQLVGEPVRRPAHARPRTG